MAWCKGVRQGLDWGQVLRLAKTECNLEARDDDPLRLACSELGLASALDGARAVLEMAQLQRLVCPNGIIFLLAVSLAYARDQMTPVEISKAQVLLWQALQDNFMLDASVWPVKTHDVLDMFDQLPPVLRFPSLKSDARRLSSELVTLVVPRCPTALAAALRQRFPGFRATVGILDGDALADPLPEGWKGFMDSDKLASGSMLNTMIEEVETPFSLVVLGGGLPSSLQDLERLVRALESRQLLAAAGPLVGEDKVYSDFCFRLNLRHYHLSFDPVYEHSVIFDEASASSIRGSWFREEDAEVKDGPCKLCETLPPTFLARSPALRAVGFHPALDSEWAVLDFSLRATRTPLLQTGIQDAATAATKPGLRHSGGRFALCPFAAFGEVTALGGPHLYGRSDIPPTGVAVSSPWFGEEAAALGPVAAASATNRNLRPSKQAQQFMESNYLKDFTGPEGVKRHFGCNLSGVNCPVPDWVYRGWAVPPCCKETMRHLLFYIDGVFKEMGIRFIVTDGVLLGSYKFGGMLDWDADVDLHIHNDDFHLLEEKVQHRVREDGHFLRKHANNRSWLLQANDQNYLLIELNMREEFWDPERVWQVPIEGRLFPAMEDAHVNLSSWYGLSFFKHRLRHVPEWEEEHRPMYCSTPYHHNCVDDTQVQSGKDCRQAGVC
eukprot:TRINITY_DN22016_c0_g1_i1.p1 TRINITY_DN22016_c0_g1~~TRINITY_DN22016_c0_g1_i1.p1  ORF type:complete len:721 (-),score=148.04 TRINITY_DN22016_c0_g1_i1:80-2077(-)